VLDPIDGDGGTVRAHRYEPRDGLVTGTYLVVQACTTWDRTIRAWTASAACSRRPAFASSPPSCATSSSCASRPARPTTWPLHRLRRAPQRTARAAATGAVQHLLRIHPAIEVAASERHRDAIGALVLFGVSSISTRSSALP